MYSSFPTEPLIKPIISAATPDFQAYPIETVEALIKWGIIAGMYIYRILYTGFKRKTFANSSISVGVLLSPVSTFVYTTGITISEDISMDKCEDENQNNASITNDATGTDLIPLIKIPINEHINALT